MHKKPLFLISTEGKSAEEMDREIEAAFKVFMEQLPGRTTEQAAGKTKPKRGKRKPAGSEK